MAISLGMRGWRHDAEDHHAGDVTEGTVERGVDAVKGVAASLLGNRELTAAESTMK
jgi:hypothetical protein